MRLTENFILQEFIHPTIYNKIGNRSADFIHPLLPLVCQDLREQFGPIRINDWKWGGAFLNSGLRTPTGSIGAKLSAHRFGCAADLKFEDVSPFEVQTYLLENPAIYPSVTRLEDAYITKTWLHLEVGTRRDSGIILFKP